MLSRISFFPVLVVCIIGVAYPHGASVSVCMPAGIQSKRFGDDAVGGTTQDVAQKKFIASIIKSPVAGGSSSYSRPSAFGAKIHTTTELIARLYAIEEQRVIVGAAFRLQHWDCEASFPPPILLQEALDSIKRMVPARMGVRVTPGTKALRVYVVKCPSGPREGIDASLTKIPEKIPENGAACRMSRSSAGGGIITATISSSGSIVKTLGGEEDRLFIDETGLIGEFDFRFKYRKGSLESLITVAAQCGLEISEQERTVDVIFVDTAGKRR